MRLGFLSHLLTAALATATAVDASPLAQQSTRHVVHEELTRPRQLQWTKSARAHSAAVIPLQIGLTQSNMLRAEELLMDVSHPDSPNYGRHWTAQQVADMFAPKQETIDLVMEWLEHEGIGRERTRLANGRHWISVNASVGEVESLLRTEYHLFRDDGLTGRTHMACDRYHVPEHLAEHIDLVTPTVHLDQPGAAQDQWVVGRARRTRPLPDRQLQELRLMRKRAEESQLIGGKRNSGRQVGGGASTRLGDPNNGLGAHEGVEVVDALMDLSQCDNMITPACLRALYATPRGTLASSSNAMGIVEYTPQAFLQSDLNMFFSEFGAGVTNPEPIQNLVAGGVVQTANQSSDFNGESSLDLEFAMALIAPQRASLFQVGSLGQGGSFNNLLAALDAGYCTFQGGNSADPNVDGQYPAGEACGGAAVTNVLSTSYGSNEADLGVRYEQRQCAEYMKLGLQGVTVLYSSGDSGVAGNGGQCIDRATGTYNNGSTGVFNPSFPGTCPYVTSVGATQMVPGSTVRSAESACESVILSGGGFSNVFAMPAYQATAVAGYYANSAPPYGADTYNNSRAVRAYPDVAANGANYVTAVDGRFMLFYGTSASAPTFGAIVNLVNEQRIAAGKGPVGFVNPVLYANPQVLTDITSGRNAGCGTEGFEAVPGWDPITGLGTPKYDKMLELFMSLP